MKVNVWRVLLLTSLILLGSACTDNGTREVYDAQEWAPEDNINIAKEKSDSKENTVQALNVNKEQDSKSLLNPNVIGGKEWDLGFSDSSNGLFLEYVLKGESIEDWSELITIQKFSSTDNVHQVEDYLNQFKISLQKSINGKLDFQVLKKETNDALYEFQLVDDKNQPDQYELGYILKKDSNIWFFHYANKTRKISDNNKKKWSAVLMSNQLMKLAK